MAELVGGDELERGELDGDELAFDGATVEDCPPAVGDCTPADWPPEAKADGPPLADEDCPPAD